MAKNTKKHYIRNGYIYVQGTKTMLNSMGAKLPKDKVTFYRKATGLEATERNLAYIQEHAVEVLYHIVTKHKKVQDEKLFGVYAKYVLKNTSESITAESYATYKSQLKRFILPYFESFNISDIKHSDLRYWQNAMLERGVTKNALRRIKNIFQMILQEAVFDQVIEANPFISIRPIKVPASKQKEPYTVNEIEKIIDKAEGWFKTYFIVSLMVGGRPKEIRDLKWSDIDFKAKKVKIFMTKVGEYKTIPMIFLVEQSLKELKMTAKSDKWVFPAKSGEPYHRSAYISDGYFKPLLEELNISYKSLHVTRHMFASILIAKGMDVSWVSRKLGHNSIKTTLKYYNLFMGDIDEKSKAQTANNIIRSTLKILNEKEN